MVAKGNPGPDPVDVLKAVYHAGETLMHGVAQVVHDLEINESQAAMLWALDPSTPPLSMRELAKKLRFDPSNVTLIADRLQELGLVERTPSPHDGRQRILVLTPRGLRVWSLLIERLRASSFLFALSAAEQSQLVRLLAKAEAAADSTLPS